MDFLVQLGEVNQRQKTYVCPVDDDGEPTKKKLESWKEIKNCKFMLINGHHSTIASQRLQENVDCGEEQRKAPQQ